MNERSKSTELAGPTCTLPMADWLLVIDAVERAVRFNVAAHGWYLEGILASLRDQAGFPNSVTVKSIAANA